MKTCVLVRHGETDLAGRFCGHSDPPLNDAGRRQIEHAVSVLSNVPEVIYTSDLKRARESADLFGSYFAVPVHVRHGLREINFGAWEGLAWEEVEQRFPADASAWIELYPRGVIPSGELYEAFQKRVRRETAFLLAEAELRSIVAVTHGGFIQTALTVLYGTSEGPAHERSAQYASIVPLPPFVMEAQ
jgi:alpha-ribazole phosphatase/probable phosphoglycerate mutase